MAHLALATAVYTRLTLVHVCRGRPAGHAEAELSPLQEPPCPGPPGGRRLWGGAAGLTHTLGPVLAGVVAAPTDHRIPLARVGAHRVDAAEAGPTRLGERRAFIDVCGGGAGDREPGAAPPGAPGQPRSGPEGQTPPSACVPGPKGVPSQKPGTVDQVKTDVMHLHPAQSHRWGRKWRSNSAMIRQLRVMGASVCKDFRGPGTDIHREHRGWGREGRPPRPPRSLKPSEPIPPSTLPKDHRPPPGAGRHSRAGPAHPRSCPRGPAGSPPGSAAEPGSKRSPWCCGTRRPPGSCACPAHTRPRLPERWGRGSGAGGHAPAHPCHNLDVTKVSRIVGHCRGRAAVRMASPLTAGHSEMYVFTRCAREPRAGAKRSPLPRGGN